ncbi:MAG: UbiA family prenyltransferase [SAR324 cluster bacterium]|nr:UbiA family prenyltransferase [SAR324 cluster bacterium]
MVRKYLEMIKFSHTVFALPFALVAVFAASSGNLILSDLFWVIVAMAGARSGAMGFNRWIDRRYDAENPRTQQRPSVTGEISSSTMLRSIIISYLVLVLAAYQLNSMAFYLSPVAIALTMFYSVTKRFTAYSHLLLGLAIGAAPIAAWIAVTGNISFASILLGTSVLCWIAGFDILYALQDLEFDRKSGLFSIPVKFGVPKSLLIARILHILTVGCWILFYYVTGMALWFLAGVFLCAGLLIWEHRLVKEDDLSRLDMAFFNMNGYISMTMLFFTALAYWV